VLQLITAEYLFKRRPGAEEGEMTQVRSAMVNTNTLAALAEGLDLGDFLFLGKGIARGGGRNLKSLLANAFEAVLGAIFLDAGYDAAYHFYLGRFQALPEPVQDENYKGRLQQVVQERFGQTPYYDSAGARGGRHREYTAVVYAGPEPLGTGHGTSKQSAEQEAARQALLELDRRDAAARKAAGQSRRGRQRKAPNEAVEERAEQGAPAAAPPEGAEPPKKARRRRKAGAPAPEVSSLPEPEPALASGRGPEPAAPQARARRRRKPVVEPAAEPAVELPVELLP